jgi:hypothetical protein
MSKSYGIKRKKNLSKILFSSKVMKIQSPVYNDAPMYAFFGFLKNFDFS